MQLEHSFSVPVGIDEAWKILLDIERVGHCMPGAIIDSVDGDDFTGTVKVKLGPINLTYKGKASFVEKDEVARRAVIDARGRDARGNGTAAAKVTATLEDAGGSTTVQVNTDLDITGKPAQFGRGVMVDVGNKLLGQFADALAGTLQAGDSGGAARAAVDEPAAADPPAAAPDAAGAPDAPAAAAGVPDAADAPETADRPAASTPSDSVPDAGPQTLTSANGHHVSPWRKQHHEVEPIDLIKHAGPAVGKRLAPVAVAALVILIAVRRRKHHHA